MFIHYYSEIQVAVHNVNFGSCDFFHIHIHFIGFDSIIKLIKAAVEE